MLIGKDKYKHAAVGLVAAMIFSEVGFVPVVNFMLVFILGVAKEVYDYFDYGKFDILDIIATVIPGAIFYLLTLMANHEAFIR